MKASSGMSALTRASGDSESDYLADTLSSGGGLSDPSLCQVLGAGTRPPPLSDLPPPPSRALSLLLLF